MNSFLYVFGDTFFNDEDKKFYDYNKSTGVFTLNKNPSAEVIRYAKLYGYILPSDIKEILYNEDQIQDKISEIANQINIDYKDIENPLILVGVLKGSFIFLADLVRQLTIPHVVDFIAVSSYGNETESSGNVKMIMDCRQNQKGRDVLIVEDIIDTGNTIEYLVNNFKSRKTNSVKIATLLSKPSCLTADVKVDYNGFEINGDDWIVGYGLDIAEKFRTLPYIGVYNREEKN